MSADSDGYDQLSAIAATDSGSMTVSPGSSQKPANSGNIPQIPLPSPPGGTRRDTGFPRLVMTMGIPVLFTSSMSCKHLALNSPAEMVLVSRATTKF